MEVTSVEDASLRQLARRRVSVPILMSLMLGILIPCQAFAVGSVSATVASVRIDESGKGIVTFTQNISGSPSCVISYYQNALAFDTTRTAGKEIYAMVLAAKATGATIAVQGKGTCAVFGSYVEDWDSGIAS